MVLVVVGGEDTATLHALREVREDPGRVRRVNK
jgi:hypothetical protein